ncbi:CPBP family intramembrane metalloprotease [Pacificimonas sp. WHA3]|uniref:CPBP family intramembrane metalloprotease n=1 Tax=Pacificimonas pallii TaxID=2827236 RepID=A0ABS6SC76_9SPHN|nr:CPBP family intramembrane glutamic endopeptidase [Pacificimonas pallii]MBV7256027.1 CPBP family intramembrane metalloprotease [Pacificimonas pallii]
MLLLHRRSSLILRLLLFPLLLGILVAPALLITSQVLQLFCGTLIFIGLLAVWARKVDQVDIRRYGLALESRGLWDFLAGIVIGTAAVAGIFALSFMLGFVQTFGVNGFAVALPLLLLLVNTLLVALWEEAFFRGFLLINLSEGLGNVLGPRNGVAAAVLISSVLFGMAHAFTDHFSWPAFAILTMNGMVWCIPVLLTGRLAISVGLHASWNFAQLKIFGFAMSGNAPTDAWMSVDLAAPTFWSGGDFGPEAGLMGVMGLIFMLAITCLYCVLTRRGRIPPFKDVKRQGT